LQNRAAGNHLCHDENAVKPHRRRKAKTGRSPESHSALTVQVGDEIVRFQEASNTVDQVAASILRLDRGDLPCLTLLLFGGPSTEPELAQALGLRLGVLRDVLARLEMAGYVRRSPGAGGGSHVELTPHAREWIDRIWEPLRHRGEEMLAKFSPGELALMWRVLRLATEVQEQHLVDLRRWLDEPAATRKSHQRGGLAPAALRRVQVFVEANIDRPIHIADLASRAGLSVHHFGRAFRTSTGGTPHAFIEQRRIEHARALIESTNHSLSEVAAAAGFATQSHLTTAFKRATGFTPAAYRRGRGDLQS
jgi:AraC family transcriptional regulator